jgi:uncharacterized protein (TIGR03663 family)
VSRISAAVAAPARASSGKSLAAAALRKRIVASWREAIPFGALAVGALVLRIVDLGARPLHHDESVHSWFAWQLATGHGYHYDPVFHGPVQFYLIALADLIVGAGDTVVRLPAAIVGALIVFIPFFLRGQLGRVGALTASTALALSPSYLYYSRFGREDIYAACATAGLIVVVLRFLDRPARWQAITFLTLLAVSFATKETTYITLFLIGLFFIALVVVQLARAKWRHRGSSDVDLLHALASFGMETWMWGVSLFLLVYTLLFSTFLSNPSGLEEGLIGGIRYWLSQQPVARGGNPWFFYLVLIAAYEWPLILLGTIGIGASLRRPNAGRLFLVWMFCSSLVVYSWASERMPWLVLHPLLPLIFLAGIGAETLWRARRRAIGQLALGLAAALVVASTYFAVEAVYLHPADPRELLVQVQTSNDVLRIKDQLLRTESRARKSGHPTAVEIDSAGGTAWPWVWYLRSAPVAYYDMSNGVQASAQDIIVSDPNRRAVASRLRGDVGTHFRLRVWWEPDWRHATADDLLRWVVHRRTWNAPGSLDEWLYVPAGPTD